MKNKFIKAGFLSLAVFAMASCSKKIDEAYQNPNADVRVAPETLLPQIISSMAANYAGHGPMNDMRYVGAYIQNWQFHAPNSTFDRMGYNNSVGDVAQSVWRVHYFDIGQNNQRMMRWATEEKKWDYVGVGKAIEAWSWLNLTDYHGDVILKEAFNTSLVTFKYDKQEEVYEYVKSLAHEAIANLNKTGDGVSQANLAKGDAFMYNGDVNKWKKFAYGVLARVHNRYTNKPTLYKADSVIHYANLSINDNADNALVKFAAGSISATHNFFGPLRGNLTGTAVANPTGIRQGAYIVKLMNGTSSAFANIEDPRAIYLLRKNANGTFVGVEPNKGQTVIPAKDRPENFWGISQETGINNSAGNPAVGIMPRFIFRNDAPFPVMTATEMAFLKAEAYFRKNERESALTAYKQGISLHFDMLTTNYNVNIPAGSEINAAAKTAYINSVSPASGAGLTLSKIMLQKYIAMFGHGVLETWVDMRRYHYIDADPSGTGQVYADFMPPTGAELMPENNGKFIYRYQPRFNSEYVWNILELQRIGATAIDYHTLPIWFSQP
ncbi:MAG TPA: SusD/RagB family nutrient-binding outer membrane lipoprotein [Flavisolibacter sp.]